MNNIEPELKRIHSPDVYDLHNPSIDEGMPYCVLIQAMFGPKHIDGEESFDLVVCNKLWIEQQLIENKSTESHQLVVDRFDVRKIEEYLRKAASDSAGADWAEVAAKLGRFGKWEFEDYVE